MGFIDKPHTLWWRKAMFQIHLWVGIALCLYMLVIGVTGSILVFESEIEGLAYGKLIYAPEGKRATRISLPEVIATVRSAYPDGKISVAYLPDSLVRNYTIFVNVRHEFRRVYVSPISGRIVGEVKPSQSWLAQIAGLHFRLLSGRTGFTLNGIGAACLLLLCATGGVIWWSGLRHWTRGLKVSIGKSWKRVNFDLHSAVGFWTLLALSMWAATAVYFVWSEPIEKFVGHFSSLESLRAPKFTIPPRSKQPWPELDMMIDQAQRLSPNAQLTGAFFPDNDKGAMTILMSRGDVRDFSKMDYIYFDPSTGKQLAVWHRGITKTWGSKLIFLMAPLHFGIYWGLAIKIIWATLGCGLPILSITGVLMYWNRSLSKRWKAPKARSTAAKQTGQDVFTLAAEERKRL